MNGIEVGEGGKEREERTGDSAIPGCGDRRERETAKGRNGGKR